jgi:DNA-binding MarR family transcriptional regulator
MIECYCTTMRQAARRLSALYDEALEPVGVNVAQFGLMRKLSATKPMSITDLAELVELERSTVARNLRVLQKAGLVTLVAAANDRRATWILLTSEGQRVLEYGAPLWEGAQRRFESSVGVQAAHDFREFLTSCP